MKNIIFILLVIVLTGTAHAQHQHHQGPPKKQEVKKKTPVKKAATKASTTTKKKPVAAKAVHAKDSLILLRDTLPSKDHSHHVITTDTMHVTKPKDTVMHDHHNMQLKDTVPVHRQHDTVDHSMHNMNDMQHAAHGNSEMPMSHLFSLSLPMNRNASGTAWNPDNSPMYMLMKHGQKSMWMFHGSLFLRYNTQELNGSTARSSSKFDAPNWAMAMYSRKVGANGLFGFSAMLSLDALTVGESGYPLLFQSGETYQGKPLVDRQHPHDLFSELAISYSHRISEKADVFAYLGYPGEPALSAPAFMHRISALNDPDAPLGHHWQDATHITFGVGTIGMRLGKFKLEGSSFTGREPDENRYDFDKPRFDSWSYRVSFALTNAWTMQFSQGWIKAPETLHPDEDVKRTTASVLYASPVINSNRYFSAALIWGLNDKGGHHKEHSLLAEASQQFSRHALYGRYEFIQKSAEELVLEPTFGDEAFNIHKISIGTNRQLMKLRKTDLLLGGHLSFNFPPAALQTLYGRTPIAGQIYLQLRPQLFSMK